VAPRNLPRYPADLHCPRHRRLLRLHLMRRHRCRRSRHPSLLTPRRRHPCRRLYRLRLLVATRFPPKRRRLRLRPPSCRCPGYRRCLWVHRSQWGNTTTVAQSSAGLRPGSTNALASCVDLKETCCRLGLRSWLEKAAEILPCARAKRGSSLLPFAPASIRAPAWAFPVVSSACPTWARARCSIRCRARAPKRPIFRIARSIPTLASCPCPIRAWRS
jgi:hypothetical protein